MGPGRGKCRLAAFGVGPVLDVSTIRGDMAKKDKHDLHEHDAPIRDDLCREDSPARTSPAAPHPRPVTRQAT